MKKLLFLLLLAPAMSFGQSPFDGTWMTRTDTTRVPARPDKYSLSNNLYECLSCVPKVAVKADGSDQQVTGHPYYDTIAVHVVDASSVELIKKKNGKTMLTQTDTVLPDGNTLTEKFTDQTEDRPITGEVILSRISKAPAGAHPVSGVWRTQRVNNLSGNSTTITYHASAEGLRMSDLNGQSYDARFDGQDYPMQGDPSHTMVSLKRVSERIIEETDKHNGKVDSVTRITVSPDGKSIHVVIDDKRHGVTESFTMEKQL
jgi:hypothetical protein